MFELNILDSSTILQYFKKKIRVVAVSIIKRSISLIILSVVTLFAFNQVPANAETASNKDVILVLDTSLSMRGYGGKDIFDSVKQSVNQFIDKLQGFIRHM